MKDAMEEKSPKAEGTPDRVILTKICKQEMVKRTMRYPVKHKKCGAQLRSWLLLQFLIKTVLIIRAIWRSQNGIFGLSDHRGEDGNVTEKQKLSEISPEISRKRKSSRIKCVGWKGL